MGGGTSGEGGAEEMEVMVENEGETNWRHSELEKKLSKEGYGSGRSRQQLQAENMEDWVDSDCCFEK